MGQERWGVGSCWDPCVDEIYGYKTTHLEQELQREATVIILDLLNFLSLLLSHFFFFSFFLLI